MNYVALFGITEIDKKYVESLRSMEMLEYFNIPEHNNYQQPEEALQQQDLEGNIRQP